MSITITTGVLWDILSTVRRDFYVPDAFIAGGAVRDLYLNRSVKDVDVWVPVTLSQMQRLAPNEVHNEYTVTERGIFKVVKTFIKNIPVDIIYHEIPEGLSQRDEMIRYIVGKFDFGLCMIWYADFGIVRSSAFDKDYCHKTLTEMNRTRARASRIERIRNKFPNYLLIEEDDPFHMEDLETRPLRTVRLSGHGGGVYS